MFRNVCFNLFDIENFLGMDFIKNIYNQIYLLNFCFFVIRQIREDVGLVFIESIDEDNNDRGGREGWYLCIYEKLILRDVEMMNKEFLNIDI